MNNVTGKGVMKRGKMVDMLWLLGAALLVAALSTGTALVSEAHHISPAWLLSFWAGIGFLMIIWNTYGLNKLRSPNFAMFAAAWLLVHVCVFLLVLIYLSFLYYLPFLVAELFLGFMAAIWLFGPPAKGSS
jgi:hypothetical protein